jgi:hypothetical protein
MKYFAPLKTKDIVSLIVFVIAGFAWIMVDQVFLTQSSHRFIAFTVIMIVLFFLQYSINKPINVWLYSNSLAAILLVFVILSSIVMHVFIMHDFAAIIGHSILLWVITAILPYLAGFIYLRTRKRK